MENQQEAIARFSSCRGVSFEITPPRNSPFSTNPPVDNTDGRSAWLPTKFTSTSSQVFPFGSAVARSLSRPSSHFCDVEADQLVDDEGDHEQAVIVDLENPANIAEDKPLAVTVAGAKQTNAATRKASSSRLSVILLDQGLFTVYKRLFVVSLTINLVMLILAATGNFPYARNRAALFSVANIFALTLCRSEAFLRIVFWLAVKLLGRPWVPLSLKTATTSLLQSLGGIHSSCGVASIAWLVYALVLSLKDRSNTSSATLGVAFTILVLLFLSALVWAFVFLTVSYQLSSNSYSFNSSKLIKTQEFWFTLAITVLIILPWLTVKRVAVRVHAPTNHASIVKFPGGMKAGILGRIARSPLSDWHAFGIISDGKKEHMMLAGAVGDFTRGLVSNPPSQLWVRGVHFAGLPYLVNMYNRVLLVATGSGLCVFLSFLLQRSQADIMSMVNSYPKEKMIIHDTAVLGRPNVAELVLKAAEKWSPEVVIVTSNPEGSRDVVNTCKNAGVPAFGPIWDS
ncbi:adenylate-forming reductase 06235 isoform X2 [Nymphaea colorata]|uniref:adenylate-forming reductase 06235 isoform X2 n=1 Tax=Nymphaea colorata TaxID=210225 RepID=UPI00129D98E7|nr:adenylate-forming reductase 06235 isoform X2 [Nymphaea colorata]